MKAATSEFVATLLLSAISIHAAREGGDPALQYAAVALAISIHAAREGGDRPLDKAYPCLADFNPRRP